MTGCLSSLLMLLLLITAAATVSLNFLLLQDLHFEEKQEVTEYINTRRSFRPAVTPVTPNTTDQP